MLSRSPVLRSICGENGSPAVFFGVSLGTVAAAAGIGVPSECDTDRRQSSDAPGSIPFFSIMARFHAGIPSHLASLLFSSAIFFCCSSCRRT